MFDPKAPVSNGIPDRIEGKWDTSWYGGGLKVCQYHGHTFVLFSLCDWRWEATGVIPSEQVYFSGIVTLADWQGWSDSFRVKRKAQGQFLLAYLDQLCLGGVNRAGSLSKARAQATSAFRALSPRSALVGRTPASEVHYSKVRPSTAGLLY